jgi:threonine aldolase
MKSFIDLRSDTVTQPSEGMRAAMAKAPVGDDVYSEDPTINSLEERVAELCGKEAALFTPTGSLSNQLGIRQLVKPGEELLTETFSHIVRAELGAGAAFSGITTRTWYARRGLLNADDPLAISHPDAGPYLVSTTAIAIENTHNFGGGTVQPLSEISKLYDAASLQGVALHLDGARLWNAHVATGVSIKDYAQYFETISLCLSKGLGAPAGSLLVSSKERIADARIWRKRYGAGMRQIGFLGAAGHYALDHNIPRLAEDHANAQLIAHGISAVSADFVNPMEVDTNIIAINLSAVKMSAAQLSSQLKDAGILTSALGTNFLRIVTHMDIGREDVLRVNTILPELLQRALVTQ